MGSTEEPERKRRNPNNALSPPLKKQAMAPGAEDKKLDPVMLHYQNQKLVQQLEVLKTEIHSCQEKYDKLKDKQVCFDDYLIAVDRALKELADDLELLALRARPQGATWSKALESTETTTTVVENGDKPSSPQETFLHRLVNGRNSEGTTLDDALASRKASTVKTMSLVVQAIDFERARNDELCELLKKQVSQDEAGQELTKMVNDMRAELHSLRSGMDALHLKHKEITTQTRALEDCRFKDQAEIARLSSELEETIAELDSARRKVAQLKNQKDGLIGPSAPVAVVSASKEQGDKGCSKSSKEFKELEDALKEAKMLADSRLEELQAAQEEKISLSEQLQRLQDEKVEEQKIVTSRPYLLLQDQVKFLKAEIDRCQVNVERFQAERDNALRHGKEVSLKAEAGEIAKRAAAVAEARVTELETKLQECTADRDELQFRLEQVSQLSGRQDTVAELKQMISTLNKEISMMQGQLNHSKEAAQQVCCLKADVHAYKEALERKIAENKSLSKKVANQAIDVNALKQEIKTLRESEQELKLILDMYEKEAVETRDVQELQQSECRARAQIQRLKEALDEHSLELRVKAANEAEAACQQRLAAAEAEIADLRQRLDEYNRDKMELLETIKVKNEEGEAYIAEIETIGQAYEEMQNQNRRLLHLISERDDYNTKLVADSLKAKQANTSLVAEVQLHSTKLQHANSAADMQKQRCARLEEQIRTHLEQLSRAAEEARQHASVLEAAKRRAAESERDALSLKSALEATDKEFQERLKKAAEAQSALEREKFEKRRLEEEITVIRNKLARNGGSQEVEKLQEEVKRYRTLLRCGVCHDRQKEVAITKCFHLFCSPCIQKNLETRHRKCPACGLGFGQSDVRPVYI